MTHAKFHSILDEAQKRHFRSTAFCCDLRGVRESIAKTLTEVVRNYGDEQVVDFSDITPGLERYEDFQLEIWRRTIVSAEHINGYLLILDPKDALAKWSADTRQLAWSFLSKARWCRGVLVVPSIEPTRRDPFTLLGCLQDDGDFIKIPYFQSANDDAEECSRMEVMAIAS